MRWAGRVEVHTVFFRTPFAEHGKRRCLTDAVKNWCGVEVGWLETLRTSLPAMATEGFV